MRQAAVSRVSETGGAANQRRKTGGAANQRRETGGAANQRRRFKMTRACNCKLLPIRVIV